MSNGSDAAAMISKSASLLDWIESPDEDPYAPRWQREDDASEGPNDVNADNDDWESVDGDIRSDGQSVDQWG